MTKKEKKVIKNKVKWVKVKGLVCYDRFMARAGIPLFYVCAVLTGVLERQLLLVMECLIVRAAEAQTRLTK